MTSRSKSKARHTTVEAGSLYAIKDEIARMKRLGWKPEGTMTIAYRLGGKADGWSPWDYYAQRMWREKR